MPVLYKLFTGLFAVIGKKNFLIVQHGLQVNRFSPKGIDVGEGFFQIKDIQFLPLVAVLQIQLAPAVEVTVLNFYVGVTAVGQVVDQFVAYFFPLLIGDFPVIADLFI